MSTAESLLPQQQQIISQQALEGGGGSRGAASDAYCGMHLEMALYAPRNERIDVAVLGGSITDKGEILCGLHDKVPDLQIQPKMIHSFGQMVVLGADRRKSHSQNLCKQRTQLMWS